MNLVEIVLLIITYTVLVVSLFIQVICYYKNLENLETIYLTVSLLILILAITCGYLLEHLVSANSLNNFIHVSMVLVAYTTPISVLADRRHSIRPVVNNLLLVLSICMLILVLVSSILDYAELTEYTIAGFLICSIVFSMLFIRITQPKISIPFREKMDRILAIAFIIVVPISIFGNHLSELMDLQMQLGFTLPGVFIVLAGTKAWDDLHRSSLFIPKNSIPEDSFKGYGLTKREIEVTELLMQGRTYNQISEELFISLPTVKTHVSNIYKKCKVNNKVELLSLLTTRRSHTFV